MVSSTSEVARQKRHVRGCPTSAYGADMIQLAFKRQADVAECQLIVKFRSEVRILEVLY